MLMNEVVQSVRNGNLTSLLISLHRDSARLFIARHVLVEMERDLLSYADDRRVDANSAMASWRGRYLPYIRVVDVPDTWGAHNAAVMAVAARHHTDAPTARLATALAPCHALVEDGDLTGNGFGDRNWLPVAHASANRVIIDGYAGALWLPAVLTSELTKSAYRSASRLPGWAQLLLGAVAAAGFCYWQHSGHAQRHLVKVRSLLQEVARIYGPILTTVAEREQHAQATWQDNVVAATGHHSTSEQVARLLAVADEPMTATELARTLGTPGPMKERTTLIRTELQQSDAFTQFSRGRWQLGEPASNMKALISPSEVSAWLQRAQGRKAQ